MTASLSVLAPLPIDTAMLTSSTAPETDYTAWSSGTTYAVGGLCISTATHRIYESLADGNLNHDPVDFANQIGVAPWWLDVGPTNRWAMFDGEVSTQTVITTPLTVVLEPGNFNALYLAKIDANELAITVKDETGGTVVFDYSGLLEASAPDDYYGYFFDRLKPKTDYLAIDIEPYNSSEITVTLSKPSGTVKCGIMALGDLKKLGATQFGAKAKPKTYSYIKTDNFGTTTIVRRKAAVDLTASAFIDLQDANTVQAIITSLLDVPCVWIGSGLPEYGGLRCFGLGSGEISYDDPAQCLLSIDVKGLI